MWAETSGDQIELCRICGVPIIIFKIDYEAKLLGLDKDLERHGSGL